MTAARRLPDRGLIMAAKASNHAFMLSQLRRRRRWQKGPKWERAAVWACCGLVTDTSHHDGAPSPCV